MNKKKLLVTVAEEQAFRPDTADALRCARNVLDAARQRGYAAELFAVRVHDLKENGASLVARLRQNSPLCIFNLFEGFCDDSGQEVVFARLLEETRIPFTGNGSAALAVCLQKHQAKEELRRQGIPVPAGVLVRRLDEFSDTQLRYPLFIKPGAEDGSVGIDAESWAGDRQSARAGIEKKLKNHPAGLIVEEFFDGVEYNVGLLGSAPYEQVGISVMDFAAAPQCRPFFTYAAKWDTASVEYRKLTPSPQADIPTAARQRIGRFAAAAAQALGCRGYCRVDLRARGGELAVIDVNPNPDINDDSGFMRQAAARGWLFTEVIQKIIEQAVCGAHR
ncbi:MAG: ATP-grasp domain-containing protein [Candidatus Omnitrophica bacterium]|nr:ATP-grasp domain-containing protein [Candidatus Omnitrophota bacterium]